jgi:hypothetical protein
MNGWGKPAKQGRRLTWCNATRTVLSPLGRERPSVNVTLPKLTFLAEPADIKETAERLVETRTIRRGRDAWQEIGKAESFSAWKDIGAALAVGKQWALRSSGANCAWGSTYSKAFSKWVADHGFTSMRPSDRSYAIALHENFSAITVWREGLPERQRNRLIGAQANVKRWRAATGQGNGQCPQDLKRDARAAWNRFTWCLRSLPAHEAAPLWQTALAEVAAMAHA